MNYWWSLVAITYSLILIALPVAAWAWWRYYKITKRFKRIDQEIQRLIQIHERRRHDSGVDTESESEQHEETHGFVNPVFNDDFGEWV
ncbi:vpu protein [Simian immunodeficiency virus]|uniref:Protein Vpu n=1 Tax=Simian immunodeficiency virus TaxID=11723 RepID=Q6VG35_SIV|nr:vpu protein [Simian immunodeficiency virus]